jgi:release factor glutamine methyltransferase
MDIWSIDRIACQLEQLDIAVDREANSLARWLWEDVLELKSHAEMNLSEGKLEQLKTAFQRLELGEPVQYIAGHAWFYGYSFKVDRNVLIPRPETEELVEWVLAYCKTVPQGKFRILDIGTGSGCIAVTLKKRLGDRAEVVAIDISPGALEIARYNSQHLEAPVEFELRDFLEEGLSGLGCFDIIVSNPPYISKALVEEEILHQLKYEPDTALYPIGPDPDVFYLRISTEGRAGLKEGGACFLEINEFRALEIEGYFKGIGWEGVEIRIDLQGMPRMLRGFSNFVEGRAAE